MAVNPTQDISSLQSLKGPATARGEPRRRHCRSCDSRPPDNPGKREDGLANVGRAMLPFATGMDRLRQVSSAGLFADGYQAEKEVEDRTARQGLAEAENEPSEIFWSPPPFGVSIV